ncbi:helix-turn-helix transcriptional regulator [Luteimonas terrae]|uniref:DNA-binding transcriptional regulator YafY n=1 Tax=Luteimonas terrae TaxID=1530191 RepID=A0ABU1XX05_9GAMM|nr:transcriptional regulator [Luteimonas terrae]MDR7193294.1 putative DNA-binding transcriptional regulator YafY [Luteimonas terrae]
MTTTERLLKVLSLLQTRRDWPGSQLASRLDVSERTVRRDIDRLRAMGYRIHATMGPEGGYRLDAGHALPPLLFDDDQAVAVAIALRASTSLGAGIEEAALRALTTIRQVMPPPLRHRLDALEITAIGRAGEAAPVTASLNVLVTLAQVIRDRQTLRFDYAPRAGDSIDDGAPHPPRRVEPHHLVTSHGRWYLVAWDLDREDWRLFRVDRVHPRVPLGARFMPRTVPGDDVDAFVSARFKGSDVNAWACRGTVRLHLPAHAVLPFVGDGTVTAIDEHSCTLESGAWSWGALAAGFGRFEVAMEVIGPPELTAAFAALAERYAQTGKTGPVGTDLRT